METIFDLPSNNGWHRITGQTENSGAEKLVCVFRLESKAWSQASTEMKAEARLMPNASVLIKELVVDIEKLRKLHTYIEISDVSYQNATFDLTGVRHQTLTFSVGKREGMISTDAKPVITFRFIEGGAMVEWFYVVDQSCFTKLKASLENALGSVVDDKNKATNAGKMPA